MKKLESLQLLRAVAALLVALYHTETIFHYRLGTLPFNNTFVNGDKGVDLFFVLSGFTMMYAHRRDVGNPGQVYRYIHRRFSRIFPLMWVASAAAIAIYALGFNRAGAGKLGWSAVVDSLFLLPQSGPALVNVTWTLKYEMFFYALFALVILNKRVGIAVLAIWQALVLAMLIGHVDTAAHLYLFYVRDITLEFGLGLLVGLAVLHLRDHGPEPYRPIGYCAAILGAAWFVGLCVGHSQAYRPLTFGAASASVIFGCAVLDLCGAMKTPRIARFLGDASYAIYLVHFSIISLVVALLARHKPGIAYPAEAVVTVLIAVSGGVAFYLAIDRPLMRICEKMRPAGGDRGKPVSAAVP